MREVSKRQRSSGQGRRSERERERARETFAIACNIKYLIKLRAHIKIALKMPCKCYFCCTKIVGCSCTALWTVTRWRWCHSSCLLCGRKTYAVQHKKLNKLQSEWATGRTDEWSECICITGSTANQSRKVVVSELSVCEWMTLFDGPTWRMSVACSRVQRETGQSEATRLSKLLTTVKFVCAAAAPLAPLHSPSSTLSFSFSLSLCSFLPNTHNKMQKFN